MNKIYSNIGLILRARKLIIGADAVIDKMKKGNIRLVLISANSSINTFKRIQNKANYYDVDYVVLNDYENNLETIIRGKDVKVMGISDINFTKLIKKNLREK